MKKFIIFILVSLIAASVMFNLLNNDITDNTQTDEAVSADSEDAADFLSQLRAAQESLKDEETEPVISDKQTVPDKAAAAGSDEISSDKKPSSVYITPTGKRFHFNSACGGANSFFVTYDEAVSQGLTPCKKCAK